MSTRSDTWCGQLRGSVGGRDCLITVVSLLRAWTMVIAYWFVLSPPASRAASRPRSGSAGTAVTPRLKEGPPLCVGFSARSTTEARRERRLRVTRRVSIALQCH